MGKENTSNNKSSPDINTKISPKDIELSNISIVKINFSIHNQNTFGLIQIFFNKIHYQIERLNAIINFDQKLEAVMTNLPWVEFEKKIIDFICVRGFNFSLSNEIKKNLYELINYKNFEEFQLLLADENFEQIKIFIETALINHYHEQEIKIDFDIEHITETDFLNCAPEEDVILVDENGMTAEMLEEAETDLNGEFVLAPVFGTPIYDLEVDDIIFIRIRKKEELFTPYKHLKPIQQEAYIKSITHDEENGHIIIAELRPGLTVKIEEPENIKIKTLKNTKSSFLRNTLSVLLNWYIILFFAIFAFILIVIL